MRISITKCSTPFGGAIDDRFQYTGVNAVSTQERSSGIAASLASARAHIARANAFDRWWKLSSLNGTLPQNRKSLAREAYYAAWGDGSKLEETAR